MIEFSGEAVTDNGTKNLGFIGENEKVMRSLSLNCNIANLTREWTPYPSSFCPRRYCAILDCGEIGLRLGLRGDYIDVVFSVGGRNGNCKNSFFTDWG